MRKIFISKEKKIYIITCENKKKTTYIWYINIQKKSIIFS